MKEKIIAFIIIFAIIIALCFGLAILEEIAWGDGDCLECEDGVMELWTVNKYFVYRCNVCGNVDRYNVEK